MERLAFAALLVVMSCVVGVALSHGLQTSVGLFIINLILAVLMLIALVSLWVVS